MDLEDFLLMCKGFWKKNEYEENRFKRMAYITHASMVSKPLHPDKLWPIGEVKKVSKEDLKKRSESVMAKIQLMQKIDNAKKNGRAVKNSN